MTRLALVPKPEEFSHITVGVTNPDGSGTTCPQCKDIVTGPGLPQTVSFEAAPPPGVAAGATFPVSARASTGLDVTLTVAGPCTGAGTNTITVIATAVGTCTITASQAGTAAYAPSAPVIATTIVTATPDPGPVAAPASAPAIVTAAPRRLLDTRPDGPQTGYVGTKPVAGQTIELQVAGRGGVPADAGAVALNVTGTDATTAGFVTVWACGTDRPLASSLNLSPGATSPNAVISKVGVDGTVCPYTQSGAHLLADATGWFPAGAAYTSVRPDRLLDTRPDGPQAGYTGAQPAAGARPSSSPSAARGASRPTPPQSCST